MRPALGLKEKGKKVRGNIQQDALLLK